MKKQFGGLICTILLLSATIISWKPATVKRSAAPGTAKEFLEKYISNIYEAAHLQESGLAMDVFKKAMTGYINLKATSKLSPNSTVLTVIDMAKSSCEKRMWVVDLLNKSLIINTWVAHGRESGEDMASDFSDKLDSHKSSLGFYLTAEVYRGENGRSLRLDGLDAGFNGNARKRAIVIHPAPYVSEGNIAQEGRLGRSYGCPAVAPEVADQVIDAIKDKTVLFINGNNNFYFSKYLNEDVAADFVYNDPADNYIASL